MGRRGRESVRGCLGRSAWDGRVYAALGASDMAGVGALNATLNVDLAEDAGVV